MLFPFFLFYSCFTKFTSSCYVHANDSDSDNFANAEADSDADRLLVYCVREARCVGQFNRELMNSQAKTWMM